MINYKTFFKFFSIISLISGCQASAVDNRNSFRNKNADICVDSSAYIRYGSSGKEATFTCNPKAVASIVEPNNSYDGYIIICKCRDLLP